MPKKPKNELSVAKRDNTKAISAKRYKRCREVEKELLRGETRVSHLAKKFGVSRQTIFNDLQIIRKQWSLTYTGQEWAHRRIQRISQLEELFRLAIESFENSKRPTIKTDTKYSINVCRNCGGGGIDEDLDDYCYDCDGTGECMVKTSESTVKHSNGDNAFLSTAQKTLAEIGKLEGLYVNRSEVHGDIHVTTDGGLEENPYQDADPEALQKALAAFRELEKSQKGQKAEVIDVDYSKVKHEQ